MRHTTLSKVTGFALALVLAAAAPSVALAEESQDGLQADAAAAAVTTTADTSQEATEETAGDQQALAPDMTAPSVDEQEGAGTAIDAPGATAGQDEVVDEPAATDEPSVTEDNTDTPQDAVTPAEGTTDATEGATEDALPATTPEQPAAAASQQTAPKAADTTTAAPKTTTTVAKATTTKLAAQAEPAKSTAQKKLDQLAAQKANSLPAGRYVFTTKAAPSKSGDKTVYAMDVQYGSKNAGAQIILYKLGNGANQRWDVTYLSNGYALIKSASSGLYLSLANGASAFAKASIPTIVQQSLVNGAAWQQWIIERLSDGSYKITSGVLDKNGQMCVIDVKGGKAANAVNLIAYKKKGSGDANQRFATRVTNDILDAEAKSHKGDLKDGTYMIGSMINAAYGLNVNGASNGNGGAIILYKGNSQVQEAWVVKHASNGYVTISNLKSGKVLDVKYGKAQAGAGIIQWAASSGSRNQQWIAERASNGGYRFVSALGADLRLVLSVSNGKATNCSAISLQKDKGASAKNESWKVSDAPEALKYYKTLADGTYFIRTALDLTKVLDVPMSSKAENAQIKLWTAKVGSNNQYWIVSHDKFGYVLFKNKNSGKYLNFSTNKVGGYNVTSQTAKAGQWVVKSAGGGSYTLTNARTKTNMDLQQGKTANGSTILSYRVVNGSSNQKWVIARPGGIKVAIDPGHGANDSGACYRKDGLSERDITWDIAQACAAKLRSYGFDVYITMTASEFNNWAMATPSIETRVIRAKNYGCVAIFSMHANASDGTDYSDGSARGALVCAPINSSYHNEYYKIGQQFTKTVLKNIQKAVGFSQLGAIVKSTSGTYPDGSTYDYYGIIRYARQRGMFGCIIEHGFIDNYYDMKILSNKNNLIKLGQADADAINAIKGLLG